MAFQSSIKSTTIATIFAILAILMVVVYSTDNNQHLDDIKTPPAQDSTEGGTDSARTVDPLTSFRSQLPSARRLETVLNQQPTNISIDPPKGPDVEDKLVIYENDKGEATLSVTPRQMCDICHATLDTGITLLRRGIALNQQPLEIKEKLMKQHGIQFSSNAKYDVNNPKTPGILVWDSQDMANEICEGAMGHFKPQYTIACHDIIAKYHNDIFKRWNHIDLFPSLVNDGDVLQHKLDFCYKSHMCVTGIGLVEEQRPSIENTPKKRTNCESCLELAGDSRMMFKRLMTTIPNPENNPRLTEKCKMSEQNFHGFKKVWCESLPMRHFRPDDLRLTCKNLTNNNKISNKLYEIIKNGNNLHRLIKNSTNWEITLCSKVTNLCPNNTRDELYNIWDQAADFDYNVTQARYILDSTLKNHRHQLDELEEEYFYTSKYMYAPDPDSLNEDELISYKEQRKRARLLEKIQNPNNNDDEIDLDRGQDEDDLQQKEDKFANELVDDSEQDNNHYGMNFNDNDEKIKEEKSTKNGKNGKKYGDDEEESTDLSPEMVKRLLGRLSYIDAQGVRIPNELPPHILREYKAKRHQLVHSVKHTKDVETNQKKLDELKTEAEKYIGKRRVWSLPDSMLVSRRMDTILTRLLKLQEKRDKGKIVEQAIQDEYNSQLKEMTDFSTNFANSEINKNYDLDDDDFDIGLDLKDGQYQDPEIDNEAGGDDIDDIDDIDDKINTKKNDTINRNTKKNHKDEL